MKKFGLLMVVLFSLLTLAPGTPAKADHVQFHWGHDYWPEVWRNMDQGNTQRATDRWGHPPAGIGFRNFRFPNGDPANPGSPTCNSNDPRGGIVEVCWAGPQDSRLQGYSGISYRFNNYYGHIYAVVNYTCTMCGYSSGTIDRITTHEVGHATGLWHTGNYSIMRQDSPTLTFHWHEREAMCQTYNGHWEGDGWAATCW